MFGRGGNFTEMGPALKKMIHKHCAGVTETTGRGRRKMPVSVSFCRPID